MAGALRELEVAPEDFAPDLSVPVTVDLVLSAARIDRVAVSGVRGDLERVTWIRTEDLMADGGWKPVACFPAATGEEDYRERNETLFGGVDAAALAKQRVLNHGPVGVEPLDAPVVPPPRPATDQEKARRYLDPWLERLEPWLALVLSQSLGGGRHQSEATITVPLDDAGQRRGAGIPISLRPVPPTLSIAPYEIVYAAGLVGFPTALLLGLACVHNKAGTALLDYRVRGRWLVEDLWAWVGARERRLEELTARLGDASPHALAELQAEVIEAMHELADTTAFVQQLVSTAVDGVVELWGLTIGIQSASRPLFAGPTAVSVAADGLGLPPDHVDEATVAVRWPLRQRARVVDDAGVPTGACVARTTDLAAAALDDVRNPNDPTDETSPPVTVLPAGPQGAAGTSGQAVFAYRYVEDGLDYLYGVSEADPFGRWSAFTVTPFRWDDLTPPLTPAEVTAELVQEGAPVSQVLTVRFGWPVDLVDPAEIRFDVHLRRTPVAPAAPVARSSWGRCERTDGTGAGPFVFDATFVGDTTHDGMEVRIHSDDRVRETPQGQQNYREYVLEFDGVGVAYDTGDRAQAWVAVGSTNAKGIVSVDLAGPARAEDFLILPPAPPVFPPEPMLATYPDANRRSTVTLTWVAPAGQRSVVYRAGEHEIVAKATQSGLATPWRAEDPPAERSAAVRAVAPQLRDAFAPVSDLLPGGTTAHTDDLDGGLRTLSVYTVVGHSPALVPGPWPSDPSSFVSVVVPKTPEPAVPVIVRVTWTAVPTPGVERLVAEPAKSAEIGAYEVYRVLESAAERAKDWRLMRPCGRFAVTVDSYVEPSGGGPRLMALLDDDTVLPWVAYLYRVVARGPDGGLATRSQPSAVMRAVTLDPLAPEPPVVISAEGSSPGTDLAVEWTSAAPDGPAGRFRFEIVDPAGPFTLARVNAGTVRNAADPKQFNVAVSDRGEASDVVVIVADPIGRRAASEPTPITFA